MGGLLDQIAKGYSGPSFLDTAQQQAQIGALKANTARTAADTQLATQQVAGAQIENQLKQRTLNDQDVLTRALTNTDGSMPKMLDYARRNGVSAPGYLNFQAGMLQHQQAVLGLKEGERKVLNGNYEEIGNILQAVKANPGSYAAAQPRLEALEPGVFPKELPPDPAERSQVIDFQLGSVGAMKKMLEQAEIQAKTRQAGSEADLAAAKAPGAAAESDIATKKAALQSDAISQFRQNPNAGGTQIDSILPAALDKGANAAYKAAYSSAMANGGPDAAQKVVEAAAAHAAEISKAVNPAIRAANVQQAVETERATSPMKVQQAAAIEAATAPLKLQLEVNKQIALAKLSPDAFGSIQSTPSRIKAQDTYEKDSKEYAQKVAAAQQLKDYVAAAQGGNKAAPGLIPLEELRGVVNRVNRTELESVSGGGSIYDRVIGKLKGATEGQPISPALLNDIAGLANVTQQAARRNYEYNVQINNQTYGGKAEPIELKAPGSPAPIQQRISVISPDGVPGTIDADKLPEAIKRGFKRQ